MVLKPKDCSDKNDPNKDDVMCDYNTLVVRWKSGGQKGNTPTSSSFDEKSAEVLSMLRDSNLTINLKNVEDPDDREWIKEKDIRVIPTLVTIDGEKIEGKNAVKKEIRETLEEMGEPGHIRSSD